MVCGELSRHPSEADSPAETETTGVWPAIPTRDYSGLKVFNPSRALSCQLVQGIFHPFGEEDGAGRCGPSCVYLVGHSTH